LSWLQGLKRRLHGRVDKEDLIHACQFEQGKDRRRDIAQWQAFRVPNQFHAGDDGTHAAAVHEIDLGHIENQSIGTLTDTIRNAKLEVIDGGIVQLWRVNGQYEYTVDGVIEQIH